MHGNYPRYIFASVQESLDYIFVRARTILEKDVSVLNPCFDELLLIVRRVVQAHHHGNLEVLEDGDVVLGCEVPILDVRVATSYPVYDFFLHRCWERDESFRYDPAYIPILYILVKIVVLAVESF